MTALHSMTRRRLPARRNRDTARSGFWVAVHDPSVTSKVLARIRELATGGHKGSLAEQERRILGLIAEDKTNHSRRRDPALCRYDRDRAVIQSDILPA